MRRLSLVCLALCLSACGSGQEDLDVWMKEQEGLISRNAKVDDLHDDEKPKDAKYQAFNFPSPVDLTKLNIAKVGGSKGLAPDLLRTKEPLEAYELDTLKMVASISRKGVITAYVKTPDGTTETVHIGNHIGQNFGRIMAINESGITIREIVENSAGEWEAGIKTLPLEEQEQKK